MEPAIMMRYYVLWDCPECGEEVYDGPNGTTLEHGGLPVFSAITVEQERVTCQNEECGVTFYSGELDLETDD